MVLEWTPEEASILQDRPFSFSAAVSVYISREASRDPEDQGTGDFLVSLVFVSFTLL